MTKPQQLIRQILDAATTGKLEDAEKAIEDYVLEFEKFKVLNKVRWIKSETEASSPPEQNRPKNIYQQYTNPKENK